MSCCRGFLGSFLLFLVISFTGRAQAQDFGLGVILGSPTGLSVKNYLSSTTAIDGALSWSTSGRTRLYIHSDYLIHRPDALQVKNANFTLYYGLGLILLHREVTEDLPDIADEDTELSLGLRAPVGLSYNFDDPPIELFAELSLNLELIPDTDVGVGLGLGGRYYF